MIVVATPVYKGSYTGLLKSFLDVLRPQALAGAVVVPVTVSAAPSHKLLADQHLRPVLAELGASVPVPGSILEERDLEDLQVVLSGWIRDNAGIVQATTIALQPVARPSPRPLAHDPAPPVCSRCAPGGANPPFQWAPTAVEACPLRI